MKFASILFLYLKLFHYKDMPSKQVGAQEFIRNNTIKPVLNGLPKADKIFADFLLEGSGQQHAKLGFIAKGEEQNELINPDKELVKAADDLVFELKIDALVLKQHIMTFTVADNKGSKITDLEPNLGSAGHVVIVNGKWKSFSMPTTKMIHSI
ncbi:hypothetical protein [Bacillus sp. 22-7]|uniref:hypothetical protein n=1 Tax=Bacillus sp. 22-7 TaxID=2709707 RepID=UPI0013D7358A|nr:hypothetical protein [Bacillus sp. 22-7]